MIIIFCLILRYSHIVFELKPRIPCDNIFNKMVPCMELQSSEVSINGLCCENENTSQGRSYDQIDIDLYDCSFSRFSHFQGYGGVIFINDGTFYMSIYKTIFFNCLSDYGGAIFFSSSNSVMRMICAKMCSASYEHFAYLKANLENHVEYLSVSSCSHVTSGDWSIQIGMGNQTLDNSNSSMNNAERISSIGIISSSSFTSSHCTFSNNKALGSNCLFINSNKGIISFSNIVHNDSPLYGVIYVCGESQFKMTYCIFNRNSETLFYLFSGTLEVSHCFITHNGTLSSLTTLSTSNNNSFGNRQTYQIQFFSSHYCVADNPLLKITPHVTNNLTPFVSPTNQPKETNMASIMNTPDESHKQIKPGYKDVFGQTSLILIVISLMVIIISFCAKCCLMNKTTDEISPGFSKWEGSL